MRITKNLPSQSQDVLCCEKMLLQLDYFYNYIPVHILVRRRSAICSHLSLCYKAKKQSFTILQLCTMYVQRYVLNAVRNIKENEIFQNESSFHLIHM